MTVKSFNELKETLSSIGCSFPYDGTFLYRGISDSENKLIPSLFYPPVPSDPLKTESTRLDSFMSETNYGINYNNETRVWVNAFLARHWGLGLRLMDWSTHLGTSLYFMKHTIQCEKSGALFVLLKDAFKVYDEIPKKPYFEFDSTALFNPPFFQQELELEGSKNRFIQFGRFLLQDYESSRECIYKRNMDVITKIEIPFSNICEIYVDCCKEHSDRTDLSLMVNWQNGSNYDLCKKLNM